MIAKERNITVAASKMYISQSSLSLRLKTLEKELGCQLVIRNRGGHGIVLTPQGERFLDLAIQYQDLTEKMLAVGKIPEKKLRIGAVNSISSVLLTEVCELYMLKHPDAELEVHDLEKTADICTWLEHNQLDLALAGGSTYKRKITALPLFEEDIVFITNQETAYADTVYMADLNMKNEVYINWSTEFIQWHGQQFSQASSPVIFVSNMTQLKRFLKQPGRWAFVPYSVAYDLMHENQDLTVMETAFAIPKRKTMLLLPARSELKAHQKEFLDTLREFVTENYGNYIALD